ncbi:MAG: hypothetical protein H7239_06960 [Flavobacterium sp.]|nr:hypothetical protein [Flavobacterium sp.]
MEIEINGLQYRQKEQNISQLKKYNKSFSMLYGMAMMFGGQGAVGTSRQRETPKVNIVEEFKLIQEKKSKLSRNDRDWVVAKFNRYYEMVS